MYDWLAALNHCQQQNQDCVLITILETVGSTPQGIGSKMLVSAESTAGSIGGGDKEYQAIQMARELLAQHKPAAIIRFKPENQHCSSISQLFFEPFYSNNFNIWLFGAGYVGQALITILAPLDCQINWIDSRENLFPDQVPSNVKTSVKEQPESLIDQAPPSCIYLVMSHSHDQDFRICEEILKRDDILYCGMIGSAKKRQQLEKRLQNRYKDYHQQMQDKLTCPMGIKSIKGRKPADIAIAIAAQILEIREQYLS